MSLRNWVKTQLLLLLPVGDIGRMLLMFCMRSRGRCGELDTQRRDVDWARLTSCWPAGPWPVHHCPEICNFIRWIHQWDSLCTARPRTQLAYATYRIGHAGHVNSNGVRIRCTECKNLTCRAEKPRQAQYYLLLRH